MANTIQTLSLLTWAHWQNDLDLKGTTNTTTMTQQAIHTWKKNYKFMTTRHVIWKVKSRMVYEIGQYSVAEHKVWTIPYQLFNWWLCEDMYMKDADPAARNHYFNSLAKLLRLDVHETYAAGQEWASPIIGITPLDVNITI